MSNEDIITLPKLLAKMPSVFANLPGLIKGSKMSKITDQNTPLGIGLAVQKATQMNPKYRMNYPMRYMQKMEMNTI